MPLYDTDWNVVRDEARRVTVVTPTLYTTSNTTATTSYTISDDAWASWSGSTPITSTLASTNAVYSQWVMCHVQTMVHAERERSLREIFRPRRTIVEAVAETTEQRADRERRQAEARAVAARLAQADTAARARAEKLLMSALTPEQRRELQEKKYFTCRSRQGNVYRLYRSTHGNIRKVFGGREVESLCVQPSGVPTDDAVLAQKLWLETDEEGLRRTANISRLN